MSTTSSISAAVRSVFAEPTRGVIGVVDDLLALCQQRDLQLDWKADRCRVRTLSGEWEALPDLPLRKSAFRALLARVAALCNERKPDSVSPYGGEGELVARADPETVFRATFTNTASEQNLALTRVRPGE